MENEKFLSNKQLQEKPKRKLKTVAEMEKGDRTVYIINCAIGITFSVISLVMFLYVLITGNDPDNRLMSHLGGVFIFLAPLLLEWLFKLRMNNFIQIVYLSYMIVAYFFGCMLNMYQVLSFMYFDKIIHVFAGYVCSLIGLLILIKLSDYKSLRPVFIVLVCFAVSMACGALWEIAEFTVDNFFGQNAQGFPVETITGEMVTTITDTMLDIVCNFVGAIVFAINFILHRATKKNLIIGSFEKGFAVKA